MLPRSGRPRALTPEVESSIRAAYLTGKSYRELSLEFGVSHTTIMNIVRRAPRGEG